MRLCTELGNEGNSVVSDSVKPCTELGNGGNSVVSDSETVHRVGEWRKQRGQ